MSNIAALADAFIDESVSNGSEPFRVAWVRSDTTYSINYLKDGVIDVALTYSPAAERIAIEQGIALSPSYYAWRDHFLIVGPPANPANISNASDIHTIFSDLHEAAEAADTTPPVRFLSRYDKSATNIKESELWISIGQVRRIFCFQLLWVWLRLTLQVPWATAYSYVRYELFMALSSCPGSKQAHKTKHLLWNRCEAHKAGEQWLTRAKDVVPPIYLFPAPGFDGGHPARRVHAHR